MDLGKLLKEYRKKNNLTQAEFGQLIGVNKQTVSKWENGTLVPSTEHYYKIAHILNTTLKNLQGSGENDEDLFIYPRRTIRYVGLNSVYEHINDFYSFYKFINLLSSAYQLLEPDAANIGFLLLDITYEDMAAENTHLIYSVFCDNDAVIVESSITTLAFTFENVSRIERAGHFNNEQYAITIHMKDDPSRFCQLLLGFDNSIEE